MERDPADRRIVVALTHALHTTTGLLLAVAVARAWQQHERPVVSTLVALATVGAYRAARHPLGLGALVVLWAVGSWCSLGFAWVAFPLYFLVLHAVRRPVNLLVVAAMAGWSAWCSGSLLGPVVGALAAVLGSALFGQQRADAQRHRALVAELRAAQDQLAQTERARGVLAERERLARDLHDTIGQGLASIVVLARTARTSPDGGQLELIEATARDNLAETRRLIRDLGAPGEAPLAELLAVLVADTQARARATGLALAVELRVDGAPRPLAPGLAEALHRGAQASLANVVQHAHATRAVVGLGWFDDRVVLDVVDDGVGFDPAQVGDDSFGLRGLAARMAQVGGTLDVDTAPGEGTTVALAVPLCVATDSTAGTTKEQR